MVETEFVHPLVRLARYLCVAIGEPFNSGSRHEIFDFDPHAVVRTIAPNGAVVVYIVVVAGRASRRRWPFTDPGIKCHFCAQSPAFERALELFPVGAQ